MSTTFRAHFTLWERACFFICALIGHNLIRTERGYRCRRCRYRLWRP